MDTQGINSVINPALRRYRRCFFKPLLAFLSVTIIGFLITIATLQYDLSEKKSQLESRKSKIISLLEKDISSLNEVLYEPHVEGTATKELDNKLIVSSGTLSHGGDYEGRSTTNLLARSDRAGLVIKQEIYHRCTVNTSPTLFAIENIIISCQQLAHGGASLYEVDPAWFPSINLINTFTPYLFVGSHQPLITEFPSMFFKINSIPIDTPDGNLNLFLSYKNKFLVNYINRFLTLGTLLSIIFGLTSSLISYRIYVRDYRKLRSAREHSTLSRKLKQSYDYKNLLELINDSVKVGGFIYDFKRRSSITTKGFKDVFCLDSRDGYECPYLDCFDIEERQYIKDSIENIRISKKDLKIETTITTEEGSKWIRIVANFFESKGNELLIAAIQDITHEKNAELYLAQASIALEQQTYALNHHAIVSITNKEGKIQYVNKKFIDISGYTEDELLGNNHSIVNSGYHDKEFWDNLWKTIKSGVCFKGDICNKSKNGDIFWLASTIVPCRNLEGEYDSYVAIRTDITARRTAEQENERLQNQLLQSQKMETIGKLTGGIAHDFNNILASIMGYSDLIKDRVIDLDDSKLEKYITQIKTSGERARDLVSKMLAFGRPNEHTPEEIELTPEMITLYDTISLLLTPEIELTINIDKDVKYIYFDKVQFQQLIMNMVINARDAVDGIGKINIDVKQGKVENIQCCSCHDLANGDFVIVTIQDDGCGMTDETINKAFDPFFTTKAIGKGTGMGLSVTHGIIHKAGGHLLCESEVDRGTIFTLLLPNQKVHQSDEILPIKYAETAPNLNIAIVDDEENILEILHEGLEKEGHNVAIYTDANDFCSHTPNEKGRNFDLILTDLSMPECSGIRLVKTSRSNGYCCPIIAMSGYNKDINIDNYKTYSFDDYLSKPFTLKEVVEKINVNIANG